MSKPVQELPIYDLDRLMSEITEDNLHGEVATGNGGPQFGLRALGYWKLLEQPPPLLGRPSTGCRRDSQASPITRQPERQEAMSKPYDEWSAVSGQIRQPAAFDARDCVAETGTSFMDDCRAVNEDLKRRRDSYDDLPSDTEPVKDGWE